MFRTILCPSSGAREYYTDGRCLWYLVLWFSSKAAACKPDTWPSGPHHTDNLKTKAPNTTGNDHLCNTHELLTMGIMVPDTCWANNKICNKYHLLHLVAILFPLINLFGYLKESVRVSHVSVYRSICVHLWVKMNVLHTSALEEMGGLLPSLFYKRRWKCFR